MDHIRIVPCGDMAISVEFNNEISERVHNQVAALYNRLIQENIRGITEMIPTYRALMIHYEPWEIDTIVLAKKLEYIVKNIKEDRNHTEELIKIPVCYGGEFGPDIETVASYNHISVSDVIKIHTKPKYLIYMIGFTPGFPYLGGMDQRIATPRLTTPRVKIEAGSVGIAGEQTGMYPIDSPGGWQIIGRTPLKLYDPYKESPILLKASMRLVFESISKEKFYEIQRSYT